MSAPEIPEAAIEEYARAAYERCDRAQASEDDVYLMPWEIFPGQQEMRDACRFDLEVLTGLGWTAPNLHPVVATAEALAALPTGAIIADFGVDRSLVNAPVIACKSWEGTWCVLGDPPFRRWSNHEVIGGANGVPLDVLSTPRGDAL